MRVIILAAGQSRRFQEVGYRIPKPFLNIEWRGSVQSMLMHVLHTVPLQFTDITVAIPRGWIDKVYKDFGRDATFVEVEKTIGPADTASQMLAVSHKNDSVLIMDSDILNHPNDLWILSCLQCCGVLVSSGTNPASSYVTNTGAFYTIKEKQRISPYAVRGAYFVPQHLMESFIMHLNVVMTNQPEPFISHVFDMMPESKFALETTYDPVDWGTPLDVKLSGGKIIEEE
jgi:dTDP-glucose pyrophosphorylase